MSTADDEPAQQGTKRVVFTVSSTGRDTVTLPDSFMFTAP